MIYGYLTPMYSTEHTDWHKWRKSANEWNVRGESISLYTDLFYSKFV